MGEKFLNTVEKILTEIGLDTSSFAATPCRDGGNNLVYEIHLGNRKLLGKQYYRSSLDQRDRLKSEWDFIQYATKVAPRNIPKPIAIDRAEGIGIYEFIEGQKISANSLADRHIEAAARFINTLNNRESVSLAENLSSASEACFSIDEHIQMVDGRLRRFATLEAIDELTEDANKFMNTVMLVWKSVREQIEQGAGSLEFGLSDNLPMSQRCVSPSDFGFHNALLRPNGEVCFIDFEYAGWDDPAKMVADFFCQPQIPVPKAHFEMFLNLVVGPFDGREELKSRTRLLFPAQKIKWVCIMMNIFLPDAAKRRMFADPDAASDVRKRLQLEKALLALSTLEI